MEPLLNAYAAPEAARRRANEFSPIGPLEVAAILLAVSGTSFVALGCIARLVRVFGWSSDHFNVSTLFFVPFLLARNDALRILLLLSACALRPNERWRAKFTLLVLYVVALQIGVRIISAVLGHNKEWDGPTFAVGALATLACFVWAMINSVRNRAGVAVCIALLIAMPLLPFERTENETVALSILAALPDCSRKLTAPIVACGLFALEHRVAPGLTFGVSWTVAALWLVIRAWMLASTWPAGSGERFALRAGLFLEGLSLLLAQLQLGVSASVPGFDTSKKPLFDMAELASFNGLTMIVVAALLRDVRPSNVTASQLRALVFIWFMAAVGVMFSLSGTVSFVVSALAMSVLLAWTVVARLRRESFAGA